MTTTVSKELGGSPNKEDGDNLLHSNKVVGDNLLHNNKVVGDSLPRSNKEDGGNHSKVVMDGASSLSNLSKEEEDGAMIHGVQAKWWVKVEEDGEINLLATTGSKISSNSSSSRWTPSIWTTQILLTTSSNRLFNLSLHPPKRLLKSWEPRGRPSEMTVSHPTIIPCLENGVTFLSGTV